MHLEVLVQIQPSPVCAWFALEPVRQDPSLLGPSHPTLEQTMLCEPDRSLALGEQLVVDSDVTVWRSADHNVLGEGRRAVVVDLACRGPSEYFEFQVCSLLCGLEVKIVWYVDGGLILLASLVVDGFLVLEEVLVLSELGTIEDIHHNVCLTDVDKHVVFKNLWQLLDICSRLLTIGYSCLTNTPYPTPRSFMK